VIFSDVNFLSVFSNHKIIKDYNAVKQPAGVSFLTIISTLSIIYFNYVADRHVSVQYSSGVTKGEGQTGSVAPGRSRQRGAKQPDQTMTNDHKSEFNIVF